MYCGYCGKKLEGDGVIICPECGARTGNDINYCTNCGGIRKKKKKQFCDFCGNMFREIPRGDRRVQNKGRGNSKITAKGKTIQILFMCVWIYGVLTALYQDLTAKTGYISQRSGEFISATDRHMKVPMDIVFLVIGIAIFIKILKNKPNS